MMILFLLVCESGRFGENCEMNCHCKRSGCGVVDGVCNEPGCVDGWSGDRCDGMYLYTLNMGKFL